MADELSPADEARLRRLLARSRHDEPIPEDVASRLEDVLTRLEAGDPDLAGPRAVNSQLRELAARRRRTVSSLLVAAAAVVAVGIGLGQLVDGRGAAGGDSAAEGAAAPEEAGALDRSEGRTDQDVGGGGGEVTVEEGAGQAGASSLSAEESQADGLFAAELDQSLSDLLVVHGRLSAVPEEGFPRSAARLQRQLSRRPPAARGGRPTQSLSRASAAVQRAWQGCAPTVWGEGRAVAVLYDTDPAILVFRPPTGDAQVVELLQCGTGESLRSVTLPAG